jgi:hypothetical protein
MRAGENLTLHAFWSTGAARCSVDPIWFTWSVGNGTATGYLNASTGGSVTFVAASFSSGTDGVHLRSAASVDCDGDRTVVDGSNDSEISIVVPMTLEGLTLTPEVLVPGESTTLTGRVQGGQPPYDVQLAWGDGSSTALSLTAPGPFAVNHTFPAGRFLPVADGMDSEGDRVNTSLDEAVTVGTGFRVVLVASSGVAEIGSPVDFSGFDLGHPAGAIVLYQCTNATLGSAPPSFGGPNATGFSCTFSEPGTQEVVFGVYSPDPGGPFQSTILYETVVPPPMVEVRPVTDLGEVGGSLLLVVDLEGGADPVTLTWNLTGNRSSGAEVIPDDGVGTVAVELTVPGSFSLGVWSNDSLGRVGQNSSSLIEVVPALATQADGSARVESFGAKVDVVGDVLSGCPPFNWWVIPEAAGINDSPWNGTLVSEGSFWWNSTYLREGTLKISVGVVDSCSVSWETRLSTPLLASLVVSADASEGPETPALNETLAVDLSVDAGWPPFSVLVNDSGGDAWNRTLDTDGWFRMLLPTTFNGSTTIDIAVLDSLGAFCSENLSVVLHPWSVSTPSTPNGSIPILTGPEGDSTTPSLPDLFGTVGSISLLLGACAAGGYLWRRRRRRAKANPLPPGPDPVSTLRTIIEPAEGAERFTVELLAEEAGISLPVVRATLDRLVAEGKVRSEAGADGAEVLTWTA